MSVFHRCRCTKIGEEKKSRLQQPDEVEYIEQSDIDSMEASIANPFISRTDVTASEELSPLTERACSLAGYEASLSGLSSNASDEDEQPRQSSASPCSELDSFSSECEQSAMDRRRNFKIRWDGVATSGGSGSSADADSNKDSDKPFSVSIPRNIVAFNNSSVTSKEKRANATNPTLDIHGEGSAQRGESLGSRIVRKRMLVHQQGLGPDSGDKTNPLRNTSKRYAASAVAVQHPFHPSSRVVARLQASQLQKVGLDCVEDLKVVPAAYDDAQQVLFDGVPSIKAKVVLPTATKHEENSIFSIGVDSLANCLSFLDPAEVLPFVTFPLSKTWKEVYCDQGYLWKVLCISEPFYAKESIVEEDEEDYYQFRLLYTRFVRCITYLKRIRSSDPQVHGNNIFPSTESITFDSSATPTVSSPLHCQQQPRSTANIEFFNDSTVDSPRPSLSSQQLCNSLERSNASIFTPFMTSLQQQAHIQPNKTTIKAKVVKKLGNHLDLPWSCAVYAIINWMVAFRDVLGIHIACLKALPLLLEDERQRSTAQVSRLSGIVIQSMIEFKYSIQLHTAAFHALVLLARPIGGKEGMLFQRAMVGSPPTFIPNDRVDSANEEPSNNHVTSINNGTYVILDSMRRFDHNKELQAMGCWSMVNIALVASQKTTLVRLGGIGVLLHAMKMHPDCAEVQFRALFALINLVVPCEQQQTSTESTERHILDDSVNEVTSLVVAAMEKFCVIKDVLNRACLVLHNLSLIREYHSALLWTPHCYQMLLWAVKNPQNDPIIDSSARGTLQRLNHTLADDDDLRVRFSNWIREKSACDSGKTVAGCDQAGRTG